MGKNKKKKNQAKSRGFRVCLSFVLLAACLLAGCSRSGGISSGTGGWPAGSQPAEISSSSQVVKVEAVPIEITEGGSADATIKLTISPGYHVNANPATFPYLIPTEVEHALDPDGFCATSEKPIYPAAEKKKFDFAEEPLAVYEGAIEIRLPIRLPRPESAGCNAYTARGTHGLVLIKVTVQACDHEKCFPPANTAAAIRVNVK